MYRFCKLLILIRSVSGLKYTEIDFYFCVAKLVLYSLFLITYHLRILLQQKHRYIINHKEEMIWKNFKMENF